MRSSLIRHSPIMWPAQARIGSRRDEAVPSNGTFLHLVDYCPGSLIITLTLPTTLDEWPAVAAKRSEMPRQSSPHWWMRVTGCSVQTAICNRDHTLLGGVGARLIESRVGVVIFGVPVDLLTGPGALHVCLESLSSCLESWRVVCAIGILSVRPVRGVMVEQEAAGAWLRDPLLPQLAHYYSYPPPTDFLDVKVPISRPHPTSSHLYPHPLPRPRVATICRQSHHIIIPFAHQPSLPSLLQLPSNRASSGRHSTTTPYCPQELWPTVWIHFFTGELHPQTHLAEDRVLFSLDCLRGKTIRYYISTFLAISLYHHAMLFASSGTPPLLPIMYATKSCIAPAALGALPSQPGTFCWSTPLCPRMEGFLAAWSSWMATLCCISRSSR